MAIDLARGIGAADRAMRAGRERWGLEANAGAFLLSGSPVGIVGLRRPRPRAAPPARAVRLPGRACTTRGCPRRRSARADAEPAGLDELLRASRVVFVLRRGDERQRAASSASASCALLPDGAVLLLMSRAGVVDFDALVRVVGEGRLRAAVDVFPEEPLAADHPARSLDGPAALPAPHRRDAGGVPRDRPARRRPTSSWSCAACRPCCASAPRPRRSAACAAGPSTAPDSHRARLARCSARAPLRLRRLRQLLQGPPPARAARARRTSGCPSTSSRARR